MRFTAAVVVVKTFALEEFHLVLIRFGVDVIEHRWMIEKEVRNLVGTLHGEMIGE